MDAVFQSSHFISRYCITRMFCEHQTFANFARVVQFATIKSTKPKLLLVNTHDPCQNAIVRSQRVKFSADLAHSQRFFTRNNILVIRCIVTESSHFKISLHSELSCTCMYQNAHSGFFWILPSPLPHQKLMLDWRQF